MPSLKGLVLWYTFEPDKIEDSRAKDRSAWENHATLYGPGEVDGKIGKGLSLDGTDDYLDCGKKPSLDFSTEFSLEIWLKSAGTQSLWARVISRGDYRYELVMGGSNGDRAQFQATISDALYYTSSVDIPHNTWSHWVGTWKSGEPLKLYLDGELKVQTGSITGTVSSTTKTLEIGRQHQYPGRNFKGIIDEVRLYNRALSDEEVKRHFQEELPAHTREEAENLAGLWIPEVSVNTSKLKDLSRWGNHGDIVGASWKWVDPGAWVLEFDGLDDYVDCGKDASLQLTEAITLGAWVQLTADADYDGIVAHYYYNPYEIMVSSNKALIHVRLTNGNVYTAMDPSTLTVGEWTYLAGTWSRSSPVLRFYRNGVEVAATTTPSLELGSYPNYPVYIGARAGTYQGIPAFIGDVCIYNRALLATEIEDHFESQRSRYGV